MRCRLSPFPRDPIRGTSFARLSQMYLVFFIDPTALQVGKL
nr:MAG TPA: hypothetical protein [Caudoviricetes sp.]